MKIIKKVILTLTLGLFCMGAESITEAQLIELLSKPGAPKQVAEQYIVPNATNPISLQAAKAIVGTFQVSGRNFTTVKASLIPYFPEIAVDNTSFQQEQTARKRAAARRRWKKSINAIRAASRFRSAGKRRAEANLSHPPSDMLASGMVAQGRRRGSRSRSRSRSRSLSPYVMVPRPGVRTSSPRIPSPPGSPPVFGGPPPPPMPPPAPVNLSGAKKSPRAGRPSMADLFSGGVPTLKKTKGPQRRSSSPAKGGLDGLSSALPPRFDPPMSAYQKKMEQERLDRIAADQMSFQQEQARLAQISQSQATTTTHVGGPPPPPPPPPGMMNQGGNFLERGRAEQAAKKKAKPVGQFAMTADALQNSRGTLSRGRPRVAQKPKKREESEFERKMRERQEREDKR
jgi:hypothetical protein